MRILHAEITRCALLVGTAGVYILDRNATIGCTRDAAQDVATRPTARNFQPRITSTQDAMMAHAGTP
jgi:hypothetical protein